MSMTHKLKHIVTSKKFFTIFILGVISGLPYGVIIGALSSWLTVSGTALAAIGGFALVKTPYSLKPAWAPLVDRFKLPIFSNLLGRRRDWMILCNILSVILIICIGSSDPINDTKTTWLLSLAFITCAATYDIVFDAYRIDILPDEQQGLGVSTAVLGYRIGVTLAGGAVLLIADYYGWHIVFIYLAVIISLGIIINIIFAEKLPHPKTEPINSVDFWKNTVLTPFKDFLSKKNALVMLLIIFFYKLGEAMLGMMTNPFLIKIGFSLTEIGTVVKFYGVIATIAGLFFAGFMMMKLKSPLKVLLICGTVQMLSNLMFVWQSYMGNNIYALVTTITIENFTGGMGTAALVGYVSALCNKNYSATQYALLSAVASFANNIIAGTSGILAQNLGWNNYFILTVIASMPALVLVLWLSKQPKNS